MASYTISPIWGAGAQLFDNSGNVLAGGKVYTYYAGTTTPLTTYTTPIGSVANSNPIVANAAGRLTNEIWFPVSGSYKFVLKDANDVLLATYDNIPTTPQPPIVNDASSISYQPGYEVTAGNFTIGTTYLITSVGNTDFVAIGAAANITGILFTATGIGSGTGTAEFSRTLQSKLRESFSLEDFGASGDWDDGTQTGTDDTVYIQAAFDYSSSTGATIYGVSGKSYRVTDTLSAYKLYFDGNDCSIIKDFAGVCIEITGGSAGSTISNVTIQASNAQSANNYSASDAKHGILVTGSRAYLTNVALYNHKGAGIYFDNSTGNSNGSTLIDLNAGGNSLSGYYFSGGYPSPDNMAVAKMSITAYGNYGYAFYADINSALRACDIWISAENNGLGASYPSEHTVSILRARQCKFWAYVEEQTAGLEMLLDTNTDGCYVWSTRRNTDADHGTSNMWQFGQIIYSPSSSRTITPITLAGDYARVNQPAEYVQMPVIGSGGTFGTLRGQGGAGGTQGIYLLSEDETKYIGITDQGGRLSASTIANTRIEDALITGSGHYIRADSGTIAQNSTVTIDLIENASNFYYGKVTCIVNSNAGTAGDATFYEVDFTYDLSTLTTSANSLNSVSPFYGASLSLVGAKIRLSVSYTTGVGGAGRYSYRVDVVGRAQA